MTNQQQENDEDLMNLFQAVGPRAEPSAESRDRAYAATLAAWQPLPEAQSAKFGHKYWAIAAAIAAVAVIPLLIGIVQQEGGQEQVGQIAFVQGSERNLDVPVHSGEVLRTQENEYLRMTPNSGVKISLGPKTQLSLHNEELLTLNKGQIYVDAEIGQLRLLTAHLQAVDIGTIYQAHVTADQTWIATREGRVELAFSNQQQELKSANGKGEFVSVTASGEISASGHVQTTDPVWSWQKVARAPLQLDKLDVKSYVLWLARDNGIELKYRSSAVVQQAALERLRATRGQTTESYSMDEALETTNFTVRELNANTWELDFRRE